MVYSMGALRCTWQGWKEITKIPLLKFGEVVDSYSPIKMALVKQREKYLQRFYDWTVL